MNTNEGDLGKRQARFWLEYSQQLSTAIRYTEALQATERAVVLDEDNAEAWYVNLTRSRNVQCPDEQLAALSLSPHRALEVFHSGTVLREEHR